MVRLLRLSLAVWKTMLLVLRRHVRRDDADEQRKFFTALSEPW